MPRPREFDCEKALEAAMYVFWEKGYEGTSYSDLSAATGVARPGLYAAFGDKHALFLKVLDHYAKQETGFWQAALDESTAAAVVTAALRHSANANLQASKPRGCLGLNGALACSDDAKAVQQRLNQMRERAVETLRDRFQQAQKAGDMPADTNADTVARLSVTFMQGIAVQAKAGTDKAEIDRMITMMIAALNPLVQA
tara:strand:- start:722 stop:1315 length:594 start_codon:yes stop_codon:yes gene_type:complete